MKINRKPQPGDTIRFNEYSEYLIPAVLEGKVIRANDKVSVVDIGDGDKPYIVTHEEAEIVVSKDAVIKDLLDTIKLISVQDEGLGGQQTPLGAWNEAQRLARAAIARYS